ncbi:MAG: ATP-binding cassette domain-containing protein [Chitinivibrionales bacterium]|nr:ATP-binding cassette domain-containing protein [Chitinivibrionales bacterium]
MSHHIVEARGLSFTYPDSTPGLHDVSFRITHRESVAVVGRNGAGKSTLLLHINGFLHASEGEMRIGEYPITKELLPEVRRTVGMVFQDPDDQLFMPTVYEDVAFGPVNLGLPPDEVDRLVTMALSRVEAVKLKDRPPYKLSAGEKRSAAIASVLSMSPSILVMDEPSSGLDPHARRNLIRLLKTFEHTKIIATHDLDMALDMCERTLVVSEGKIAADGPTKEIMADVDLLHANGLEKPLRMQGCPVCGERGRGD